MQTQPLCLHTSFVRSTAYHLLDGLHFCWLSPLRCKPALPWFPMRALTDPSSSLSQPDCFHVVSTVQIVLFGYQSKDFGQSTVSPLLSPQSSVSRVVFFSFPRIRLIISFFIVCLHHCFFQGNPKVVFFGKPRVLLERGNRRSLSFPSLAHRSVWQYPTS
jgi:hypothetical protein